MSKPIFSHLHLDHFAFFHAQQRNDALLGHALAMMQAGRDADALIAVESVCRHCPGKAIPALLRARIVERCRPGLASKAWYVAWTCDPENAVLQDGLLASWLSMNAHERVIELGRGFLPKRCQEGTHANLLKLLQQAGMHRVGVCWIAPSGVLAGRIFYLTAAPDTSVMQIAEQDADFFGKVQIKGDAFSVVRPKVGHVYSLAFDDGAGELFQGSPLIFPAASTGFAQDYALNGNKNEFYNNEFANNELTNNEIANNDVAKAVDIVVPVYRGFAQVRACLQSVLNSLPQNQTQARLIVINDASPEPELRAWLHQLAQQKLCILIDNWHNLGFVEAVNRGMRHEGAHDVLLLNADTLVHGDWIDRLHHSLYAAADIAAVTPWSNNGEISSFPKIVHAAPMPDMAGLAELDDAAASLPEQWHDVVLPVCCGFTMMIKRQVLNQIGLLDGAGFFRGYGEEVDWCLRARAAGYRHMLAIRVFVAHGGGVSFGMEKTLRVRQNRAVLMAHYPDYYPEYDQFIQRDGLAKVRTALSQTLSQTLRGGEYAPMQENTLDADIGYALPAFLAPALSGGARRLAVWHLAPESLAASKVLQLARLIASRPEYGLRLLVFGGVSEAMWHTGVVDGLPEQSSHKSVFSDQTFLGLSACIAVLAESDAGDFDALPYYQINQAFDPLVWLEQCYTTHECAAQQGSEAVFE